MRRETLDPASDPVADRFAPDLQRIIQRTRIVTELPLRSERRVTRFAARIKVENRRSQQVHARGDMHHDQSGRDRVKRARPNGNEKR